MIWHDLFEVRCECFANLPSEWVVGRQLPTQETGARVTIHERPDSEGGCLAQKLDPSEWC